MRRFRWVPLACSLALLSMLLYSNTAVASSPLKCGTWSIIPSSSPGSNGNYLFGVSAISNNDIWTVGANGPFHNSYVQPYIRANNDIWTVEVNGPAGGGGSTLIEHWNGSQWSVIPSPSPGSNDNSLYSVSATAGNDVWAVGKYLPAGGGVFTLIEHWNGSQWSVIPSPNPSPYEINYLYGVSAVSSTDVWAVGVYASASVDGDAITLIEHWDGSQWSVIPSPNPSLSVNTLYSVSAVSSTDVWAVGYYSPPSGNTYTLTEHWDGSQWSVVSSPSPGPYVNYLYGVSAVSSTDAWAVGYFSPLQGGAYTLIEHWNGKHWHQVKSPNPTTFANHLVSVSALSKNQAWAVGYYLPNPSTVFTLTEHWNGSHWKVVPSPNPAGPVNLTGVALVPGTSQAWTVGHYGNGGNELTLTEFYC